MSTKTDDLFATITDRVIEAIESDNAGQWTKPWTTVLGAGGLGINAQTKNAYQGFNQFVLMFTAATEGYDQSIWATYKQFESLGGQVRKGEKGTQLVKWGKTFYCQDCDHKGRNACPRPTHKPRVSMWASAFTVFNIAQQDGFEMVLPDLGEEPERLARVEEFITNTGAVINYKVSNQAYYSPVQDEITLPERVQFNTVEGFYGTALHELSHWTGHSTRLDRTGGKTFGDHAYAGEELVAELSATFLAARFGVEVEPHMEHAAYLKSWLGVLRADPKALYNAAKLAQAATEFLLTVSGTSVVAETVEVAA